MKISTKELGLAAYIKINGAKFLDFQNKLFFFESDKTLDSWRVEYYNSESYKHDTELLSLRKFL